MAILNALFSLRKDTLQCFKYEFLSVFVLCLVVTVRHCEGVRDCHAVNDAVASKGLGDGVYGSDVGAWNAGTLDFFCNCCSAARA